MTETAVLQYVIYKSPRDFPGKCVARMWIIGPGTADTGGIVAKGTTVEEVRKQLPSGLIQCPVYEDDDSVIAEVWMENSEVARKTISHLKNRNAKRRS